VRSRCPAMGHCTSAEREVYYWLYTLTYKSVAGMITKEGAVASCTTRQADCTNELDCTVAVAVEWNDRVVRTRVSHSHSYCTNCILVVVSPLARLLVLIDCSIIIITIINVQ
jgi:hypothetical protein